jgi:hypothetical protein
MEQGYAYKPSAPAPLSAAPPVDYPREGFGTRSSIDLAGAARVNSRMEAGKVTGTNGLPGPHVLFDSQESGQANTGDESNDWDNSDEESSNKKTTAGTAATTTA